MTRKAGEGGALGPHTSQAKHRPVAQASSLCGTGPEPQAGGLCHLREELKGATQRVAPLYFETVAKYIEK